MSETKESLVYKFCKLVVPNISQRFSDINPLQLLLQAVRYYRREQLRKVAMYSNLFGPLAPKFMRPMIYRKLGCKIGNKVYIGREVLIDPRHTSYVIIEDKVTVTDRCTIMAHKRDMNEYNMRKWVMDCPHIISPVVLKKKCHIGIGSIILPGVTIGEGSIIGAGSVVTKSIPSYTIAVGNPARVIRKIE